MTTPTRRRTLSLAGGGIVAALAGCIDSMANEDGNPGTPTPTGPTVTDTFVHQLGSDLSQPGWLGDADHQDVYAALFEELDQLHTFLEALGYSTAADELDLDIDEALLDEAVIGFLRGPGPNTCHDTMSVDDVEFVDGELTVAATVTSSADEDAICGEAITYPNAVVVAAIDGEVPDTATVSITTGWDETETRTVETGEWSVAGNLADGIPVSMGPEDEPSSVPQSLSCEDDNFERLQPGYDPQGASSEENEAKPRPAFSLRVNDLEQHLGDTIEITLNNVTDAPQHTGNRHKYNLEVFTEAGWQDIRGWADGSPRPYTDEAIEHQPEEGFTWEISLTPTGVLEGHRHEDALTVCPDLPTGRYRFVFWEPLFAVEFDVLDAN